VFDVEEAFALRAGRENGEVLCRTGHDGYGNPWSRHATAGPMTCTSRGATPVELSVTTSRQDDVSVVTVAGEVDVYTAAQLRAVLDEEIGAGNSRLVVDLDEVSFLDSTGLGVLVGRLKLVRNHSGWLCIVCTNDRILRVFRITGLDKVFGIHDSLADALAA
jgi:anti-sigma B factor antagonist